MAFQKERRVLQAKLVVPFVFRSPYRIDTYYPDLLKVTTFG